MPLSALVENERMISTRLTADGWAALKADVRAKRRAITMPCGWPGLAKTSKLGTPHFAHKPGGDGCSAGETAQHLLAKAVIVEAVVSAGWSAQTEVAGDGWVADVMATRGTTRVVFEVQWTNQTLDEYSRRQQHYRDAGIASIAWFARRIEHLPIADPTLPVFSLMVTEDGEATIRVDGHVVSLFDAVERLLTRRLRHREYYATGQPSEAVVEGAEIRCYRCEKPFGIWNVREIRVEGRCGGHGVRRRGVELFAARRPESEPEVTAAGVALASALGLLSGRIFSRSTKTSGTRYMAFTCPHCNATCGDYYVADEFSQEADHQMRARLAPTAVHHPHWCLAGDEGPCAEPPPRVVEEAWCADEEPGAFDATATVSRVVGVGGMPIHQVVGRMFGGYRTPG